MIRKEIRAGVGCSVIECDGVRRVFATVAPSRGVTLLEQAESALQATRRLFHETGVSEPAVTQTVFLKNIEDQAACREIVETFYGQELPATSYVPQPPCDGTLLAIEAWGLAGGSDDLQIERCGRGMVTARHNGASLGLSGRCPSRNGGRTDLRPVALRLSRGRRTVELHRLAVRSSDSHVALSGQHYRRGRAILSVSCTEPGAVEFYRSLKFGDGLVPASGRGPSFPPARASAPAATTWRSVALRCGPTAPMSPCFHWRIRSRPQPMITPIRTEQKRPSSREAWRLRPAR